MSGIRIKRFVVMINGAIGDVCDGDVILYHRSVYSAQIMAVVVETPCIIDR